MNLANRTKAAIADAIMNTDRHEMTAEDYRRRFGGTANDELARISAPETSHTSPAKEAFEQWLRLTSPSLVCEEYEFLGDRKYRADWAIPNLGILFEYDGFRDHGTRKGSERDAEKSNLAQLAGWLFIRVNSNSINDGSAYTVATRAMIHRAERINR